MSPARQLIITLILMISGFWCNGQVRVTGHICAEVVESVSASCSNNPGVTIQANGLAKADLGSFSTSGTASSTCTLVIDNASISNSRGETYTISTTTSDEEKTLIADANGKQSLTMVAGTPELLTNGQYYGNYRVTFAYN